MKLSELIKLLQNSLKNVGDMDVYVNGEHGVDDSQIAHTGHISVGSARLAFDTDDLDIDENEIVCHIGGY